MISQQQRRLVHICVLLLVVLVFTIEYLLIMSTWRRPECGYRTVMITLFLFTVSSEVERMLWKQEFLFYVPRISVVVLSTNVLILESVMLYRRKAFAKQRRIYDEQMLAEDRFAFES